MFSKDVDEYLSKEKCRSGTRCMMVKTCCCKMTEKATKSGFQNQTQPSFNQPEELDQTKATTQPLQMVHCILAQFGSQSKCSEKPQQRLITCSTRCCPNNMRGSCKRWWFAGQETSRCRGWSEVEHEAKREMKRGFCWTYLVRRDSRGEDAHMETERESHMSSHCSSNM